MARRTVLVFAGALCLLRCGGEPRLEAGSIYGLNESTRRMKQELELSKAQAAALDQAIDVLVGEAMRSVLAEGTPAVPGAEVPKQETQALAPLAGLTFEETVRAATVEKQRELQELRRELMEEETRVAEDEAQLVGIRVLQATYGMSSSRRSWIDLTLANHTERTLGEVLLDCQLVETGRAVPRQKGTCAVAFQDGLEPAATRSERAYVGWDTNPSSRRHIELRPIRATDKDGEVLWQIPSRLNPMEAGKSGELESRSAVVEKTLQALAAGLPQEPQDAPRRTSATPLS